MFADGHDVARDYRAARSQIGLVPQELATDAFETVWDTVNFSRGLFGRAPCPRLIERLLRDLSLSDKRDARIITLVGRHETARDDREGSVARTAKFCSSTNRPPASTSNCDATCGRSYGGCATAASRSS